MVAVATVSIVARPIKSCKENPFWRKSSSTIDTSEIMADNASNEQLLPVPSNNKPSTVYETETSPIYQNVGPSPDRGNVCLICHDTIKDDDEVSREPECGTVFHSECFAEWIEQSIVDSNPLTCPLCRIKILITETDTQRRNNALATAEMLLSESQTLLLNASTLNLRISVLYATHAFQSHREGGDLEVLKTAMDNVRDDLLEATIIRDNLQDLTERIERNIAEFRVVHGSYTELSEICRNKTNTLSEQIIAGRGAYQQSLLLYEMAKDGLHA